MPNNDGEGNYLRKGRTDKDLRDFELLKGHDWYERIFFILGWSFFKMKWVVEFNSAMVSEFLDRRSPKTCYERLFKVTAEKYIFKRHII
jgi:hypothetical protein